MRSCAAPYSATDRVARSTPTSPDAGSRWPTFALAAVSQGGRQPPPSEAEIERFTVMERDGAIIACAALYPYPETGATELACLVVDPDYRSGERGDRLLKKCENLVKSKQLGPVPLQ